MPRGVTLGQMIEDLRVECKYSANPAQGQSQREMLKTKLQRTQRMLWIEYDWPYMRVGGNMTKSIDAGQRYCDVPDGMDLEGIRKLWVKWGNTWTPLARGISDEQYNEIDSDTDMRTDPVLRWELADNGTGAQIELWPIPATAVQVRFHGLRALKPFVADTDVCDIDSDIIVMSTAGELLNKEDGKKALAAAQGLLEKAKDKLEPDTRVTFGGDDNARNGRPPEIRVVYAR